MTLLSLFQLHSRMTPFSVPVPCFNAPVSAHLYIKGRGRGSSDVLPESEVSLARSGRLADLLAEVFN